MSDLVGTQIVGFLTHRLISDHACNSSATFVLGGRESDE